jgi:flagellar motor switch/type III secretory pathway protein FliN
MTALRSAPAQPLLLLGTRRRAALRDTLASCVDQWRSRWSTAREPIRVLIQEELEQTPARSAHSCALMLVSAQHGTLGHVSADAEVLPSLLGVSTQGDSSAAYSHRLAQGALLEVLRSLSAELAKWARLEDSSVEPSHAPGSQQPRCRLLPIALHVGAAKPRVTLLLTARMVELLAPPQTSKSHHASSITRRRRAVADEPVRVEAMLGETEVSLRELMQLAVGDVIVLDQPLNAAGRLAMPDGRTIAPVVLGRADERRAVSVCKRA